MILSYHDTKIFKENLEKLKKGGNWMSEKIRILKSRWNEVPSGTIAYISQYDIGMHLMTCDSGVIIVLQGYP